MSTYMYYPINTLKPFRSDVYKSAYHWMLQPFCPKYTGHQPGARSQIGYGHPGRIPKLVRAASEGRKRWDKPVYMERGLSNLERNAPYNNQEGHYEDIEPNNGPHDLEKNEKYSSLFGEEIGEPGDMFCQSSYRPSTSPISHGADSCSWARSSEGYGSAVRGGSKSILRPMTALSGFSLGHKRDTSLWSSNGDALSSLSVYRKSFDRPCRKTRSRKEDSLVTRTQTLVDVVIPKFEKGRVAHVMDIASTLPKEVWIMYGVKYLESYSYFILAYTLVMYLSDEFGFGDEQAAWTYGIYGMLVSVYGLGMGVVIDHLGVRKSLLIGLSVLIGSRLIIANTQLTGMLLLFLFTLMPLGAAMTLPVLQIGIKRYTNERNRTVAFSGFYIVMNLSAMTAAPCIDEFHRWLPGRGSSVGGQLWTPYRTLILLGAVLSFVSLLITYKYIVDEEADSTAASRVVSLDSFKEAFKSDAFWRFVLLAVLLLGVRSVFRHLDATFPKFMIRTFGKSAPYGALIALNPICVVLVTAIVTPWSAQFHPVPVIIFGSFISAFSPFFLALGHTYANAILFVLFLSIGEGIWSPRLYEYSVMIAEKGREGTYMALAAAPMFLATLLTGATSGILLEKFAPEHGPQHPEIMWALIGLSSCLSPVLMVILRPVIEQPARRTTD